MQRRHEHCMTAEYRHVTVVTGRGAGSGESRPVYGTCRSQQIPVLHDIVNTSQRTLRVSLMSTA